MAVTRRWLVTGATGFVGGALVRQLRERGDEVVALVRRPDAAGALRSLGVEVVRGDVTDRATLAAPLRGTDGVFHVAASYEMGLRGRRAREIHANNVDGTRNVLETALALGVPKIVYTSSIVVHSDTRGAVVDETHVHDGATFLSHYERTKWRAHHEVALPLIRAGAPIVIAMPGAVYGPGDHSTVRDFIRLYLRGIPVVPARCALSFVHVDDAARAHVLAMDRGVPGESYHLVESSHSLGALLEIAERVSGVRASRLRWPAWMLRACVPAAQLVELFAPLPQAFSSEALRFLGGATLTASGDKAVRELGWRPRSIEEGLRELVAHEARALGRALPAPRAVPATE